jgi:hypothetical protein
MSDVQFVTMGRRILIFCGGAGNILVVWGGGRGTEWGTGNSNCAIEGEYSFYERDIHIGPGLFI